MSLTVTCDECSKSHRVRDDAAGKRLKCQGCGKTLKTEAPVEDLADYEETDAEDDDNDGDDFEVRRPSQRAKSSGSRRKAAKKKSRRSKVPLSETQVSLGINLVLVGFLLMVFVIFGMLFSVFSSGRLVQQDIQTFVMLLKGLAYLGMISSIVTAVGKLMCLTAPSQMTGKVFIYISAAIDVLVLTIGIAQQVTLVPKSLADSTGILWLIGMVCFLLFLQQLGKFMRDTDVVERASGVLRLGIVTGAIWVFSIIFFALLRGGILLGPRNINPGLMIALVIWAMVLSLIIVGSIGVIRYALLLLACRQSLKDCD